MNYFELFALTPNFEVDAAELKSKFRTLQSQFHPDKFANENDQLKSAALQKAALINDAFSTLTNPVRRAEYLLSMQGVDLAGEQQTLQDMDFLMQQMQLRESLEQIESSADPEAAIDAMAKQLKQAQLALETEFVGALQQELLTPAADAVRKMKFYARLTEQLRRLEDKLLEF